MITSIIFLPLISALIVGLFSRTISNQKAINITSFAVSLSAVLSVFAFYDVVIAGNVQTIELLRWFDMGGFDARWALKVDVLTAVMLVVVTVVSAVVHIYSAGYMHHDPHVPRFMAYLSLFTFSMLMLVTSDNFVQLFFGWEGVGLCSYLLIGFWYKKPSANAAAIKAFVVNRVGDFGFALGIFLIFMTFDSVYFDEVFRTVPYFAKETISVFGIEANVITVICLLLFIGCMGKSAQLGLHTWLPDAMEGPTPVSALIHAATMVTAGVFLVARCSPIFEFSPLALNVVAIVGAATAIFAATVAITQNDIKRIIAYSTCSQLGYMFFACGVSAYSAGVFHLATHAFFKALLFLGSGSVIHAMSDEQDIRKMGGIWKKIPITYGLMWIGSLALAGVFPFAGYYSKDIVLESAWVSGDLGQTIYWVGILAAFLTAFYSWRLLFLTFHGTPRASDEVMSHIHESPKIMLYPLYLLAFGAIVAGAYGYYGLDIVGSDGSFWRGAIFVLDSQNPLEAAHNVQLWVKYMPLFVGLAGIALAYILYIKTPGLPAVIAKTFKPLYNFSLNKWYIDELYNFIFVKPTMYLSNFFWHFVDVAIVDKWGPNGAAALSSKIAARVSKLQSGYLYVYAFFMLIGVFGLISWYLLGYIRF